MPDENGAAPAEGAATAPETTNTGLDLSPVMDRVNELASNMDARFEALTPRQEPDPEPDPWAQFFGPTEPEPDPNAQQTPQFDQQALQAAIDARVQQMVGQQVTPLQTQLQQFQLQQATQQLYQQIPQLADVPESHPDYATNQAARQATAAAVQQSIAKYRPEVQQQLINDPDHIALVFMAAEAKKLAQGQAPAGGPVPTLEAAGGAHPGGNGEAPNPVHQAYGNQQRGLSSAFH